MIWLLVGVALVAVAVVAATILLARRFVHETIDRSPLGRYVARDLDPARHGPAGTFEGHLCVRLWAPSPLEGQRLLERVAGELKTHPAIYLAELDTIARCDEDAGDE